MGVGEQGAEELDTVTEGRVTLGADGLEIVRDKRLVSIELWVVGFIIVEDEVTGEYVEYKDGELGNDE